ncbi:MBL fold metallo-hydrolase [Tissierella pigra]|uniref:MBL fold metallo-hydrolase n=1 Tax=Tissierella pigra TaxID=2607614 RepID=A0A6N7XTR6_9FIRM|nr:MBL fold metallo-hydrolase [Tissierella pigra]MBU5426076.1 MBL fold metallo-hydrolase [Tissierella pigra]MSU00803.1 MBL fold metallo-hydrolase [Tissierella pigra]
MVTKVYENIYMIEVVLPENPLKALNSYVIKGKNKSLIIDTGFNRKECIDGLFQGLKELDINIEDTELFITHLHADHSGMASIFKDRGIKIYAGEIDGRLINEMTSMSYWERFEEFKVLFDLERDRVTFSEHPGYKYCLKEPVEFTYISEGKGIQVGNYFFEVIDIPGHTPGHIGLYERNHKLFFCGDHILDRITPNIGFWGFEENILAVYFNSLAKIYSYDIDYLFPSHRNIIRDHTRRITELLAHHKERLGEILYILESGESTVRDVTARMEWKIRANSFEDFPIPQKWFAAGEAMAHLEYLYCTGKLYKELREGKLIYKLK